MIGRLTRISSFRTRYARISRKALRRGAWRCTRPGGRSLSVIDSTIPSSPTKGIACCAVNCRLDGTAVGRSFPADTKGIATRDASGQALNALAKHVPWLLGGSADLGPSCKTRLTFEGAGDFSAQNPAGRNLHFGIREHAMGAILNGLSLSKIRPFGSGFLIFSDYGRAPIRLGALMEIPVIHIFTHNSIGVRGRWADTPASRASGISARDPRTYHPATSRCQ